MTRIRVLLAAIAALVTMAAVALSAQGAQASTPGCTNGAYFGYCGTQADHGSSVLVMDSRDQSAATNNPVIGWVDAVADPGTDWFQLAYAGDPSLGVMFVFAPGGVITGMCAADPGNSRVVLRGCNGSNWQRWVAAPVGTTGYFTWTNRATHRILRSGGRGGQLVTVTPSAMIAATQQWKFSL